ncbi:hypothetical protein KA005_54090, partial [bacterium]|nr:hypothetical protein [bacterium]
DVRFLSLKLHRLFQRLGLYNLYGEYWQHRHEHISVKSEPELKIIVNRGQRGGYGWEIPYSGIDKKELIETIGETDRGLTEKYTNGG